MSQILGDQKAITRVKNAKPGDPMVCANMELIENLPEAYEGYIIPVNFDPDKDFSDVGNGNYMPNTDLVAEIAKVCGIDGDCPSTYEPVYQTVDINPMLCKGLEEEPTVRKMIVGYAATKSGKIMQDDGTYHKTDPCTVQYNAWERVTRLWADEEAACNGYDQSICKDGKYIYFGKEKWGKYYQQGKYCYPIKYATKWDRQKSFKEELLFAQRKADTKARNIVIQVGSGMKKNYSKSDLAEGCLYFHRIKRSEKMQKMVTAAQLSAIANGKSTGLEASNDLFGEDSYTPDNGPDDVTPNDPDIKVDFDLTDERDPWDTEPDQEAEDDIFKIFEHYFNEGLIVDAKLKSSVEKALPWLSNFGGDHPFKDAKPESKVKVIGLLKAVEAQIPEDQKIVHIYGE